MAHARRGRRRTAQKRHLIRFVLEKKVSSSSSSAPVQRKIFSQQKNWPTKGRNENSPGVVCEKDTDDANVKRELSSLQRAM